MKFPWEEMQNRTKGKKCITLAKGAIWAEQGENWHQDAVESELEELKEAWYDVSYICFNYFIKWVVLLFDVVETSMWPPAHASLLNSRSKTVRVVVVTCTVG